VKIYNLNTCEQVGRRGKEYEKKRNEDVLGVISEVQEEARAGLRLDVK
jgi:hypothetical protein